MFSYVIATFNGGQCWQSPIGALTPEQACNYLGKQGGELVSTAVHGDTLLLFFKHAQA
jgi:hypothetical protein